LGILLAVSLAKSRSLAGGASEGLLEMHHKATVAATAQMASKHLTFIFMGSVLNQPRHSVFLRATRMARVS
jgi:hypothetical protein